ncbi:2-C-methyl-D-erythritol 4-phosphate cytidylyltransferase [Phytoactinopolyspora mesophila]|uniref:2-C-methyl-D-erythritol 4-phosphate cytidylyltransferase n=1 Tax=Phytoactinopolyspora mesophila TaxID=2650750 RepID=A0A7K3M4A3_9ACTN|nr:2-C-methyl-D-erythritol 4-phosphate cytidylyltransferase [Phytoactinopolyspora mesophila]NDL58144.1 2-C-methyl-D-erythritol 4-phosphate cytidylyltransferase [Phytoactinopolyspora mesophila]
MNGMAAVGLIIPAAGMGERLGVGVPKALYTVGGQTLLGHALRSSVDSGVVSSVVIAAPVGLAGRVLDILQPPLPRTVNVQVVDGGRSRQESVRAALAVLPENLDVVLVHDAARCLTPAKMFVDIAHAVWSGHDAVVPGLPVVDTLKQVNGAGEVTGTPDRSVLRAVQTPQGFRRAVLERAHNAGAQNGSDATDDAGLVERMGSPVHVVPGDEEAFKVTRPLDLLLAEAVLARRRAADGPDEPGTER